MTGLLKYLWHYGKQSSDSSSIESVSKLVKTKNDLLFLLKILTAICKKGREEGHLRCYRHWFCIWMIFFITCICLLICPFGDVEVGKKEEETEWKEKGNGE